MSQRIAGNRRSGLHDHFELGFGTETTSYSQYYAARNKRPVVIPYPDILKAGTISGLFRLRERHRGLLKEIRAGLITTFHIVHFRRK